MDDPLLEPAHHRVLVLRHLPQHHFVGLALSADGGGGHRGARRRPPDADGGAERGRVRGQAGRRARGDDDAVQHAALLFGLRVLAQRDGGVRAAARGADLHLLHLQHHHDWGVGVAGPRGLRRRAHLLRHDGVSVRVRVHDRDAVCGLLREASVRVVERKVEGAQGAQAVRKGQQKRLGGLNKKGLAIAPPREQQPMKICGGRTSSDKRASRLESWV
mmetsp:Transcript_51555/g.95951  ORF Transcript_51555/g.95951 Transcript_51555/m.95951 type:complete len:217 (+) Transcript_51555:524-1174(+)